MESKPKRDLKNIFLPQIATLSEAQKVGRQGTWAACFVAGLTALVAVASLSGILPADFPIKGWALVDAALFGVIAWGIYRMSRVAAVAGLAVYILERIYMQSALGAKAGSGIVVTILIILAFINAVRGTFAYHRMKTADGPLK
jgi:hypothetical protein